MAQTPGAVYQWMEEEEPNILPAGTETFSQEQPSVSGPPASAGLLRDLIHIWRSGMMTMEPPTGFLGDGPSSALLQSRGMPNFNFQPPQFNPPGFGGLGLGGGRERPEFMRPQRAGRGPGFPQTQGGAGQNYTDMVMKAAEKFGDLFPSSGGSSGAPDVSLTGKIDTSGFDLNPLTEAQTDYFNMYGRNEDISDILGNMSVFGSDTSPSPVLSSFETGFQIPVEGAMYGYAPEVPEFLSQYNLAGDYFPTGTPWSGSSPLNVPSFMAPNIPTEGAMYTAGLPSEAFPWMGSPAASGGLMSNLGGAALGAGLGVGLNYGLNALDMNPVAAAGISSMAGMTLPILAGFANPAGLLASPLLPLALAIPKIFDIGGAEQRKAADAAEVQNATDDRKAMMSAMAYDPEYLPYIYPALGGGITDYGWLEEIEGNARLPKSVTDQARKFLEGTDPLVQSGADAGNIDFSADPWSWYQNPFTHGEQGSGENVTPTTTYNAPTASKEALIEPPKGIEPISEEEMWRLITTAETEYMHSLGQGQPKEQG